MKILLVTRGSQGDVYPYFALAAELQKRGHAVTLSLPEIFKERAEEFGLPYVLQAPDDIMDMVGGVPDTKNLLKWTRRVIDSQFKELPALLKEHDVLIASNTEFAAASIAEYGGKPLIRTAYGPFIPSKKILPPISPLVKPHPFLKPMTLWKSLNRGLNFMVKKTINNNRQQLGLPPITCQAKHAPSNSDNLLLYSKHLGNIDEDWNYKWGITGYCFNDLLPYSEDELAKVINFIKKDERPTIYFSLGSCNAKQSDRFASLLHNICTKHGYKLLLSKGWWNAGAELNDQDNIFRIEGVIPHRLFFPYCSGIIHHGGTGTTHSAARAGRPQLITPIILDQFYWGQRVHELALGPSVVKIKGITEETLEIKILDLVTNSLYQQNAKAMSKLLEEEGGLIKTCEYIEKYNL